MVLIAVILVIVPPLVLEEATFSEWIYRALSFLVVSCPCALVISVPLSFFGGIGGASKVGVLVKGSNYLEALANTEITVFDKTGTLTKGVFEVQQIHPVEISKEKLLETAAYAEYYSNHPIAQSIKKAYGKEIQESRILQTQELSGLGIEANIDSKTVLVGNEKLLTEKQISYEPCKEIGTVLYVAIEGKYAGYILIADSIKADAKSTILELKKNHIKQAVMLTGDKKEVGEKVAKEIGMDVVYSELLPADKVETLADIGIAMGGLGADSAIEAADVVLMTDEPSKILQAIQIAKKTMRIVKENIVFAIAVKIGVLILTAFGLSTMWQAVFADVGVSVIAILNALRALNVKVRK